MVEEERPSCKKVREKQQESRRGFEGLSHDEKTAEAEAEAEAGSFEVGLHTHVSEVQEASRLHAPPRSLHQELHGAVRRQLLLRLVREFIVSPHQHHGLRSVREEAVPVIGHRRGSSVAPNMGLRADIQIN